ncbi:hypothetical protein GKD07_07765 [Lactobacillus rhamnosus]|nr:hypothetical protein [Lacticaseibacillus rhamnosus]MSB98008.1 hypothetical protein [Lacticaseibacillus rhamnosus]MSC02378.1 hypothetical protein [Lacticaseibacillus rhamnosus]MSC08334.1 hypothetical protein [Lacticaseibacillus rhamnosus]MSC12710.1 hypothetical protein [Lacticaseibacillus rhamnosus]
MMARFWPLRQRSLHADSCAGERVMVGERVVVIISQECTRFRLAFVKKPPLFQHF